VVKADGLAAGKGVIVCDDADQARDAVRRIMVAREFGDAGGRVVVEERLVGREVSVMAFTDGKTVALLPPARDHKRVGDGDQGPNTGGMGAYAPAPDVDAALLDLMRRTALLPAVAGLAARDTPYVGVLYAGVMLTADGPRVLEFNCRLGDPETQAVLPLLETDLFTVLIACVEGRLAEVQPRRLEGAAVEHQRAADAGEAPCARLPQQFAQRVDVEVDVALSLQHEVALQHAVVDRPRGQQARTGAPGRPQLLQSHKGCHQLHRRRRLQRPPGLVRDEGRATGCRHDDEAKRGRRHARLLEPLLQRRGKLGLRRGRGEQAAAQQQRGKRSCKAAAAEAGADRQKNGKQHAQAGRVGRLRVGDGKGRCAAAVYARCAGDNAGDDAGTMRGRCGDGEAAGGQAWRAAIPRGYATQTPFHWPLPGSLPTLTRTPDRGEAR